jgi:hypothetical protein
MPEEQDIHADHDGYKREHVKHDACLPSHRSILLFEDRIAATDHAAGRQRFPHVIGEIAPGPVGFVQRPAAPSSSERPASKRDHWAIGRPLAR